MKLIIGESEYDVWESVNYATFGALDDLQEQSSTAKFDGITDPYIRAEFIKGLETLDKGQSLRGHRGFRKALMGIVFLAKRAAGENVTFEDVRNIPYLDAQLRFEEKEVEAAEAPKESGAAENAQPE